MSMYIEDIFVIVAGNPLRQIGTALNSMKIFTLDLPLGGPAGARMIRPRSLESCYNNVSFDRLSHLFWIALNLQG